MCTRSCYQILGVIDGVANVHIAGSRHLGDVVDKGKAFFIKDDSKIADWRSVRYGRGEICWKEVGGVGSFTQLLAESNYEEFCFGRV